MILRDVPDLAYVMFLMVTVVLVLAIVARSCVIVQHFLTLLE